MTSVIGKRFKLGQRSLGLERVADKRSPMLIPGGATIEILSDPTYGEGLVNVLWETQEVAMFLSDIGRGAEELLGESPGLESDWNQLNY